jgi:hypothetical protein
MAAPQQAPPATVPGKTVIKKAKTATLDVDVSAEILADGTTTDATVIGHTAFTSDGNWPDGSGGTVFFQVPGYSLEQKGALTVISKLDGPVEVKGVVKIQTVYGPDASATKDSAYGRGTTTPDEAAGNTTLGFHESCHRADFMSYLRTKPLPTFGGKVGQTEQQYSAAITTLSNAFAKYFTDMDSDSFQRTDEVGYKYSTYDTKGPRP